MRASMNKLKEIRLDSRDTESFIQKQAGSIAAAIENGLAINALSGGVDSAVVTMLGHKAIGSRLKTYFIDNGLMRKDEPANIVSLFKGLGVYVEVVDAKDRFLKALRGLEDPEAKREAITQAFYKDVFGGLVRESSAKFLLQGTILTDIDETVAGIKRQHNVFEQLGIDPQKSFGYRILEPLVQLRKDSVRVLAKALGLPESIYSRPPFPGPALAARIIGEVTQGKLDIIRHATFILENKFANIKAFQYMAILHNDKVTGMRDNKRSFGMQIEIRCWDSVDARVATPTDLPYALLRELADKITSEVPGIVSVTYNLATKPPSTIEAI
jgi:GMP synthase (glutamine-hydrolysing)